MPPARGTYESRHPGRRRRHPAPPADPRPSPSPWCRSWTGPSSATSWTSWPRSGVTEIVFSVAYQPERIQAVFGDGARPRASGSTTRSRRRRWVRAARSRTPRPHLDDTTIVFNGDVLTDVDLPAVVRAHRASRGRGDPRAGARPQPGRLRPRRDRRRGRVRRFVEKPDPSQITTDTINAGIYVLDTSTLALMPPGVNHSIERAFFPDLLAPRRPRACPRPSRLLDRHRHAREVPPGASRHPVGALPRGARRRAARRRLGPPAASVETAPSWRALLHRTRVPGAPGARVGPDAVLTARRDVAPGPGSGLRALGGQRGSAGARVEGRCWARGVRVGRHARVGPGGRARRGHRASATTTLCGTALRRA